MSKSDCLPDAGGTLFLASVCDVAEAELAIGAGADIVDLKDPDEGALGALAPETIEACVRAIGGRVPVSATVGDLPLEETAVRAAVLATASRGVDYVKLGLFPEGDAGRALQGLARFTPHIRLILVLFADALPEFDAVTLAGRIGAVGTHARHFGQARRLAARVCLAGRASSSDLVGAGERARDRSCRIASCGRRAGTPYPRPRPSRLPRSALPRGQAG